MNSPATGAPSEGSLTETRALDLQPWQPCDAVILVGSFGLSKALPAVPLDRTTPGSDSKAAGELIAKAFPGNNGQTVGVVGEPFDRQRARPLGDGGEG